MDAGIGRIAGALLLLASLWIATYWLYKGESKISRSSEADIREWDQRLPSGSGVALTPSVREPDIGSILPTQPRNSNSSSFSRSPDLLRPPPLVDPLIPSSNPSANFPSQPLRPIAVVPPEFISHIIKQGETFSSIANQYYGDSRLAWAVAEANPLMSPTSLRVGRTIRIAKDWKNIQGLPVVQPNTPAPNPGTIPGTTPASPSTTTPREYTIARGDTLSVIAKRLLGDIKYADAIYEANKDRLASPDDLRVGQLIRIPARP